MEYIVIAFLIAVGKLFVICRVAGARNIRKVLYFNKWIDIFFTLGLPLLFLGTWSGMAVAMLSGMWISLFLASLKLVLGSEAPAFISTKPIH